MWLHFAQHCTRTFCLTSIGSDLVDIMKFVGLAEAIVCCGEHSHSVVGRHKCRLVSKPKDTWENYLFFHVEGSGIIQCGSGGKWLPDIIGSAIAEGKGWKLDPWAILIRHSYCGQTREEFVSLMPHVGQESHYHQYNQSDMHNISQFHSHDRDGWRILAVLWIVLSPKPNWRLSENWLKYLWLQIILINGVSIMFHYQVPI